MKLIDYLVHALDPYNVSHGDFELEIVEDPAEEVMIKQHQDLNITPSEESVQMGDVELGEVQVNVNNNSNNNNSYSTKSQTSETSLLAKQTLPETEEKCDDEMFVRHSLNVTEEVEALATQHNTHISNNNNHSTHHHSSGSHKITKKQLHERLNHMGMLTALAIGLHNFPEGLATFVATINDPTVGAALAVAIAIHNIPEGLCVAIPISYASEDLHKAFLLAFISGWSEIFGALLGWIILLDVFNPVIYGILFGLVAGMMVNICIYQLIPTAHRYDPHDVYVSNSIVIGMVIMAASLVAFMY